MGYWSEENVPMTVSAIGVSNPVRWVYSTYDNGKILNAYNIKGGVSVNINLGSENDVNSKLKVIYQARDNGCLNPDDVSELEERIRTYSNFVRGGGEPKSQAALYELDIKEGKTVTVYRDGKPYKVKRRDHKGVPTDVQIAAAANARKFAHTDEANKKRRKSIKARRDAKTLGEI